MSTSTTAPNPVPPPPTPAPTPAPTPTPTSTTSTSTTQIMKNPKKKKNCTHLRSFIHDLFVKQCAKNDQKRQCQRASIEVLQNATHNLIQQLSTELLQLKASKSSSNSIVKPFDVYYALHLIFANTPDLAKDVKEAYEDAQRKLSTPPSSSSSTQEKKKSVTARCGLVLPITRIKKRFRRYGLHYSFSRAAVVVLTAALETVLRYWIKCALGCMKDGLQLLQKKHLDEARNRDAQLNVLFDRRHILISGTTGIYVAPEEKKNKGKLTVTGKRKRVDDDVENK